MSEKCRTFIESLTMEEFKIYQSKVIFRDSFFNSFLLGRRNPNQKELDDIKKNLNTLNFPEEFIETPADIVSVGWQLARRQTSAPA